ncbi:hypothetical protein COE58_05905 [Bacillus cereus]|nr:hypothetical protein COL13_21420 [Bacillus cereus]PGZ64110.1 hypothetical protein COE58_05905 [Bacillus cereus]
MLLFYKKRNVYVKTRRDVLHMSINIISIVSIIIWIVLITELIKPSKEQNVGPYILDISKMYGPFVY